MVDGCVGVGRLAHQALDDYRSGPAVVAVGDVVLEGVPVGAEQSGPGPASDRHAQVLHCGGVVADTVWDTGPRHDQGHPDGGFMEGDLALTLAVLAEVVAVVGGEDDDGPG